MLNRWEIIGNLGGEPEMRFTPNGNPVTQFSVAVNSRYGGEVHTEWVNVVAWNRLAETCNQYLAKGRQVYVAGRCQSRQWEDSAGVKHNRHELIADTVRFLGRRPDDANDDIGLAES